jgi:hypothetical protein
MLIYPRIIGGTTAATAVLPKSSLNYIEGSGNPFDELLVRH